MIEEVSLALAGLPGAELRIAALPVSVRAASDESSIVAGEPTAGSLTHANVQLFEESEYGYSFHGVPEGLIPEPAELFNASDKTLLHGRIKTRRSTGTVQVSLRDADGPALKVCRVEIRSRKLEYLTEFRWMLDGIASVASEGMQLPFAAGMIGALSPATASTTESLYQRFSFLNAIVSSDEFSAAMALIARAPHFLYEEEDEWTDPARGARADSRLVQDFASGRVGVRRSPTHYGLPILPAEVRIRRHEATFDTVPNRFVRHALESWEQTAIDVADACSRRSGESARRGHREALDLASRLRSHLSDAPLVDVGRLASLPMSNTMLQGRPGYRELLRLYFQAEAAAAIDWQGGDDCFAAGLRDVATLYEYWAFLELAACLEQCEGVAVARSSLFKASADRLSFELRRGKPAVVSGAAVRRGAAVTLELWFNRTFSAGESWSEPLRPDASLLVQARFPGGHKLKKWLHFDAKYRLNTYESLFTKRSTEDGWTDDGWEQTVEAAGAHRSKGSKPLSEDLLKMHAYRDAIRRTSGAYVLYPGSANEATRRPEFHEVLPGLGAFALRPSSTGHVAPGGARALVEFIEDAIDHLVATGTDEERSTYWNDHVHRAAIGRRMDPTGLSSRPPADVHVLVGWIRSDAHRAWVQRVREYNLRADGRQGSVDLASPELSAELLCIWGAEGSLTFYRLTGTLALRTADDLQTSGYPHSPGGKMYVCLQVAELLDTPAASSRQLTQSLWAATGRPRGAPFTASLADLLG